MPLAFHDAQAVETLGFAAFFHLEAHHSTFYGALFLINARGEPQEFVFNRLEPMRAELWREGDQILGAARRLGASLGAAASLAPTLLLFRSDCIAPAWLEGIAMEIPVGELQLCAENDPDTLSTWNSDGELQWVQVRWHGEPPRGALFGLLQERGLLLEPFERAAKGLREAYDELE